MDPEQVPGGLSGVGEVLPPPPLDVPQAGLHYPLERVPDIHPSTLGDVPPRHIIPALIILIVLFGWRPLSVLGDSILTSVRALPTLAQEELAAVARGVDRAVSLIHEQDQILSERIIALQAKDQVASLSSGVQSVFMWLSRVWESIVAKWYLFLSGSNSTTQALADAKEELKAQVRAELLNELQASSTGGGTRRIGNQKGIIVLPKTNIAEADRLRTGVIQGVFSDQVIVMSDETGQSGVVRPIFRSGVGEEYLYVMVPVDNQ